MIHIRKAETHDFEVLHALDQSCFAPGIAYTRAELRYFLVHPGNFAFVAASETDEVVGFAIVELRRRHGLAAGHLITIEVEASHRRGGIGSGLMHAVEAELSSRNAHTIELEVAADNVTAQRFYHRHGYLQHGHIAGYYAGNLDALVMQKSLLPAA